MLLKSGLQGQQVLQRQNLGATIPVSGLRQATSSRASRSSLSVCASQARAPRTKLGGWPQTRVSLPAEESGHIEHVLPVSALLQIHTRCVVCVPSCCNCESNYVCIRRESGTPGQGPSEPQLLPHRRRHRKRVQKMVCHRRRGPDPGPARLLGCHVHQVRRRSVGLCAGLS